VHPAELWIVGPEIEVVPPLRRRGHLADRVPGVGVPAVGADQVHQLALLLVVLGLRLHVPDQQAAAGQVALVVAVSRLAELDQVVLLGPDGFRGIAQGQLVHPPSLPHLLEAGIPQLPLHHHEIAVGRPDPA